MTKKKPPEIRFVDQKTYDKYANKIKYSYAGSKCLCAEKGKNGKAEHDGMMILMVGEKGVDGQGMIVFSCHNHLKNYRRGKGLTVYTVKETSK